MELRSATGHQFTTTGNTTICLRTRDGINVAGDFQIAPKDTGLQRSFISVGQVCDRGNIITFRSIGGTILNEFTGNGIEFERAGGVYRLKADASAKTKSGTGGIKLLMGFEQDTAGAAEAQPARPGNVPALPSEADVEQHELTHLQFRSWCRHCVRAKGKERPHHDASPGGVSKFTTDCMFMGEDGRPITISARYDGLTKAFFADVVPCKGTSHGYAERALAHNVLSTGHQKVILQSVDAKHKAGKRIPTEIVYEESPVGDSHANCSIEGANQTIQGQIRAIKDYTERQIGATIGLDSSVLKWLVRHAAWMLTTSHVGSDGMTAHQRIRGKPFNQQIAAFGEQILFKPHKTAGPQQKLAVNWMDGWLGFNTRTGEHIVSNNAAVVTCRSIRRRNKEERWNREMLLGILGNPWSLQDGRVEVDPDPAAPARYLPTVKPEVTAEPTVTRTRNEEHGRRIYITKKMVCEFGATLGCKGCLVIGQPHTAECRARITARMENDPVHAKRLEENLNRRNEFANPETTVAVPIEGATHVTKRARQGELEPPQASANTSFLLFFFSSFLLFFFSSLLLCFFASLLFCFFASFLFSPYFSCFSFFFLLFPSVSFLFLPFLSFSFPFLAESRTTFSARVDSRDPVLNIFLFLSRNNQLIRGTHKGNPAFLTHLVQTGGIQLFNHIWSKTRESDCLM